MKIQQDTNFIIENPNVEEQVSHYSNPKQVTFKKDPKKNKIELKSLASFWGNLYERDILTKEIASKASIKLSSRNYYKLKLMQLYSDKFMSMNDLFNASLAFATASEIKINEPNAFKLQEYEEFSKIILRTTRYFLTKGDSSELKTVELIDFSYFRYEVIAGMLWFLMKGKETISHTPKGRETNKSLKKKIKQEILKKSLGLSIFFDINNYRNNKVALAVLQKIATTHSVEHNFFEDSPIKLWVSLCEVENFPYEVFLDVVKIYKKSKFNIASALSNLRNDNLLQELSLDKENLDDLNRFLRDSEARKSLRQLFEYRLQISPYLGIPKDE